MRRTLLSLTGAAALALALSACGDSDDSGGGGGDEAGCTTPDSSITVGAQDALKFDAEAYEADAGCVEFTYTNEGSVAHTLLIKGKSGFKLEVGDEDTGSIELTPGDYTLFCDIAGHEPAGMTADLTVT
jgi:plastocyanin